MAEINMASSLNTRKTDSSLRKVYVTTRQSQQARQRSVIVDQSNRIRAMALNVKSSEMKKNVVYFASRTFHYYQTLAHLDG